jgi:hypothetical protein
MRAPPTPPPIDDPRRIGTGGHPRRSAWRIAGAIAGTIACTVALSSCRWVVAGPVAPFAPTPRGARTEIGCAGATCSDSVDIIALGVDGYLLVPWRDTTTLVMTPPSISNPSLARLALVDWWWGTRPHAARVAARVASLPGVEASRLARVAAVLVGHGHYDHAMDIPPLAALLPNATVFGSRTATNLLAPAPGLRLRAVDDLVGRSGTQIGESIAIGPALRVRPIAWAHAPNIARFTFASGSQRTPRTRLPRSTHGWKMGEPLAWAIDVLDARGDVALRLFHHDAGAAREVVLRAMDVLATMPAARTTVVIMTAANYDKATAYPDAMLATLQPDHLLLGHWEDFFRAPEQPLRIVRGIRGRELIPIVERFQQQRWTALAPGATLRVRLR